MAATDPPAASAAPVRPLNAPGLFIGIAAIGAVAIAILTFTMLRTPQIPAVISLDYTRVAGGVVVASVRQHDANALSSALSSAAGVNLTVPDLSAAGFVLEGGTSHAVLRHAGLLAIYHNPLEDLVVWQQFIGSVDELPATSEVREHAGRRYFVHRKSTNVLVFWQDGPRVSVLTSSLPSEQVVALSFRAS